MYRDEDEDILIRQIRRFAEALGALFRGGAPPSSFQIDDLVRDAVGLRLATLDLLPPEAIASLGSLEDDRWRGQIELIATILEQLAAREPAGADARREKARALRDLLGD